MTPPHTDTDTTPDPTVSPGTTPWLGAAVVRRLRLPGPPIGAPLPSRIGSLASGVQRFALSTGRPVEIRRALNGPDPGFGGAMRPPRWWVPTRPTEPVTVPATGPVTDLASGSVGRAAEHRSPEPPAGASRAAGTEDAAQRVLVRRLATTSSAPNTAGAQPRAAHVPGAPDQPAVAAWLGPASRVADVELPDRSLPRAARSVPNEQSYSPGGLLAGLTGQLAPVRRYAEAVAAGPMLVASDRARLRRTPQVQTPPSPAPTVVATPLSAPREAGAPTTAGRGSRPEPTDRSDETDRAPSHLPVLTPALDGAHATRFVQSLRRTPSGVDTRLAPLITSESASGDRVRLATGSAPEPISPATGALLRRSPAPSALTATAMAHQARATARRAGWAQASVVGRQVRRPPETPRVARSATSGDVSALRSTPVEPTVQTILPRAESTQASATPAPTPAPTSGPALGPALEASAVPIRPSAVDPAPDSPDTAPDATATGTVELRRVLRRSAAAPRSGAGFQPLARVSGEPGMGALLTSRRPAVHGVGGLGLATAFAEPSAISPASGARAMAPAARIGRGPEAPGVSGTGPSTHATPPPPRSAPELPAQHLPAQHLPAQGLPAQGRHVGNPSVPGAAPLTAPSHPGTSARTAASGPGVLRWARTVPVNALPATSTRLGTARIGDDTVTQHTQQWWPATGRGATPPGAAPIRRRGGATVAPASLTPTVRGRSMTPAPPRGLAPAPGAVAGAPQVPAVATGGAGAPGSGSGGSLLDATAALFSAPSIPGAAPPASAATIGVVAGTPAGAPLSSVPPGLLQRLLSHEGGHSMNSSVPAVPASSPWTSAAPIGTAPVSAGAQAGWHRAAPAGSGQPLDAAGPVSHQAMLDELVDEVVARIERKVIDELERRGQRQGWTGF